jgi:hypothetical protein
MNGSASRKRELSKRGTKPSTYGRIVTGNVNRIVRQVLELVAGACNHPNCLVLPFMIRLAE